MSIAAFSRTHIHFLYSRQHLENWDPWFASWPGHYLHGICLFSLWVSSHNQRRMVNWLLYKVALVCAYKLAMNTLLHSACQFQSELYGRIEKGTDYLFCKNNMEKSFQAYQARCPEFNGYIPAYIHIDFSI